MEKIRKPTPLAESMQPHMYEGESIAGVVLREKDRQSILTESGLDLRDDDKELQEFLSHPDLQFPVLRELFAEHIRKAGGKDVNFIEPDRIFRWHITKNDDELRGSAFYHPDGNFISFSDKFPILLPIGEENTYHSEFDELYAKQKAAFTSLHTLLHEEWHAVGVQFFKESYRRLHTQVQAGFRENYSILHRSSKEYFKRLDEAFVEYMSRRMLPEFVARVGTFHGLNANEARSFVDMLAAEVDAEQAWYNGEVLVLEMFIEACALLMKVTEEDVVHGIIRSYLRGGDVFSPELAAVFKESGRTKEFTVVKNYFSDPQWQSHPEREDAAQIARAVVALGDVIRAMREHVDG